MLYVIIAGVVLGFLLLVLGIYYSNIQKIRDSLLGFRYDDNNTLKYFTEKDFKGLKKEETSFLFNGEKIQAYFYKYDLDEYKGIVVLAHGLGAGHIQYTSEINYFASRGYIVYTYDLIGTLNSEGECIGYFQNAVLNLHEALNHLETFEDLKKYKVVLYGHSLGGYAVNCINYFDHKIAGVVSLSGFINPEIFYSDILKKMNKDSSFILNCLLINEKRTLKKNAKFDSYESLKDTKIKTLLISGSQDHIVNPNTNFFLLRKALSENKNIEFLLVNDRYHRPNISLKAANYDLEVDTKIAKMKQQYEDKIPSYELRQMYSSFNYRLLVEFDKDVMEKIYIFIENC